jgi:hypothetical protein
MRTIIACGVLLALVSMLAWHAGPAGSQTGQPSPAKLVPKLEPIAETKLIMEGLAHANFRGLERQLAQKPAEQQNWVYARGQALLIAETANLLMLRPPRNQGQPIWFERAMELRNNATQLAQTIASKDYPACRAGLQNLAGVCNRCHQTFRVPVQITTFENAQSPSP